LGAAGWGVESRVPVFAAEFAYIEEADDVGCWI